MSPAREIITLQVGNYSNFVGAHWFNIQQEYLKAESELEPGVLWREGLSRQGKGVWTPRLLIFDLKGNWGSHFSGLGRSEAGPRNLSKELDETEKELHWDGRVERVVREDSSGRKKAAAADRKSLNEKSGTPGSGGNPSAWPDYAQWKLHSTDGAAFSLSDSMHNSSLAALPNYEQGTQIYSLIQEEVMDGIRRYVEPCDYFVGFHLLVDQQDGFGGVGSGILQHIHDDYEKKTSLALGMSPPTTGMETSVEYKRRVSNIIRTWSAFNDHASLFTSLGLSQDLSVPNPQPRPISLLNYQAKSAYSSSAILAAALDTITGTYRLRNPSLMLHELVELLSGYGHKMTMLGSCFPLSLIGSNGLERTLYEMMQESGLSSLHCLTPGLPSLIDFGKSIGNFFVARGVPDDKVIRKADRERISQGSGGGISNAESCVELYSQETCSKSVNVVRSVVTPFKLSHPFPTLLVDQTYLQTQPKFRHQAKDSWKLPALGSAHNTLQVGDMLGKMIDGAQTGRMKHTIVDADEYEECLHDLRTLRETYSTN